MGVRVSALILVLVAGCTGGGGGSTEDCGGGGPCAAGRVCRQSLCVKLCSDNSHCGSSETCDGEVCRSTGGGDPGPGGDSGPGWGDDGVHRPVAAIASVNDSITGMAVLFDGTGSSDSLGHNLAYAWTVTSRPVGSVAAFDDATSATPRLMTDLDGTYTVQLTVDDGPASSRPDSVTLTTRSLLLGGSARALAEDISSAGLSAAEFTMMHETGGLQAASDYAFWYEFDEVADESLIRGYRVSTKTSFDIGTVPGRPRLRLSEGYLAWETGAGVFDAWEIAADQHVSSTTGDLFTSNGTHALFVDAGAIVRRDLAATTQTNVGSATGTVRSIVNEGTLFAWTDSAGVHVHDTTASTTTVWNVGPGEWLTLRDGVLAWSTSNNNEVWGWKSGAAAFMVSNESTAFFPPRVDTARGYIVWELVLGDSPNQTANIYVYDVDGGGTTTVSQETGNRGAFHLAGGRVFWTEPDRGSTGRDVLSYDLVGDTMSPVVESTGDQYVVAASGDWVCWADYAQTNEPLVCRNLQSSATVTVVDAPGYQTGVTIAGSAFLWSDRRTGFPEIYVTHDDGATETQLSRAWTPDATLARFGAVAISGYAPSGRLRALLAAAGRTDRGFMVLPLPDQSGGGCGCGGCGISRPGEPSDSIQGVLDADEGAGLQIDTEYSPPEVSISPAPGATSHPIFTGIDTDAPAVLGPPGAGAQAYVWTTVTEPNEWTVIAVYDTPTTLENRAAVVFFRATSGTPVLLDGTPIDLIGPGGWTAVRGQLLINELSFLAR